MDLNSYGGVCGRRSWRCFTSQWNVVVAALAPSWRTRLVLGHTAKPGSAGKGRRRRFCRIPLHFKAQVCARSPEKLPEDAVNERPRGQAVRTELYSPDPQKSFTVISSEQKGRKRILRESPSPQRGFLRVPQSSPKSAASARLPKCPLPPKVDLEDFALTAGVSISQP